MKKWLAFLLCITLLCTPLCSLAEGAPLTMQVVNCTEWVSLRKDPDPDSVRLLKVPLDAIVEDCTYVTDGFVHCSYNGFYGYILSDYLMVVEVTEPEPETEPTILDLLPSLPPYALFIEAGTNVLEAQGNGCTVAVQRAGRITHEKIMAIGYDERGSAYWQTSDVSGPLSELTLTDAFMAGTEQDPLLVMFVAGKGFHAYAADLTGTERWHFTDGEALNLSGSLSHAVSADGTIYAVGYYNNAPLCLNPDGSLKWKAQNDRPDIYHPWKIQLTDTGVEVWYNESDQYEGMYNVAIYDFNGMLQQIIQK